MAPELPAFVPESLNNIPQDLRGLYVEQKLPDGKVFFTPNVKAVDGWGLENVQGLKGALGATKEELKAASAKLKSFEGLDPEAARVALAKVEEMKTWTPEQKVKETIAAAVAAERQKFEPKMNEMTQKYQKLTSIVTRGHVESEAIKAIANHKGEPAFILPVIHSRVKPEYNEATGEVTYTVMEANGTTPMYSRKPNSGTETMKIDEFVELLKTDPVYSKAFEGSRAVGSGSSGSSGSAGSTIRITKAEATNHQAYVAAKERAAKEGKQLVII